jgi:hypothetical protein
MTVCQMTANKMAAFWDAAPRSLLDIYRECRGACCLHHQGQFGSLLFITSDCDCVRKDFCHLYSETILNKRREDKSWTREENKINFFKTLF